MIIKEKKCFCRTFVLVLYITVKKVYQEQADFPPALVVSTGSVPSKSPLNRDYEKKSVNKILL